MSKDFNVRLNGVEYNQSKIPEEIQLKGKTEKEDYFKFLCSGGSRYPIESLKLAGVDMASQEPVQAAINVFTRLVDELEALV